MQSQLTVSTPCDPDVVIGVLNVAVKVFPEFIVWIDGDNICIGPPGDDGAAPVPAVVPEPPPTLPGKLEIETPEYPNGHYPPFTEPFTTLLNGTGSLRLPSDFPEVACRRLTPAERAAAVMEPVTLNGGLTVAKAPPLDADLGPMTKRPFDAQKTRELAAAGV